jgi:outer membrane immunogenic protein
MPVVRDLIRVSAAPRNAGLGAFMNKTFCIALGALGAQVLTPATPVSAATLDEVIARLDAIQRENSAMRKEIAALRAQRHATPPSAAPRSRAAQSATSPHRGAPRDAMAADLAARPSTYDPYRPYDWSGFYTGLNAGFGFGQEETTLLAPPVSLFSSRTYDGFLGGAQLGYNFHSGYWMAGIEADIQIASIGGSYAPMVPGGAVSRTNTLDAFGTLRGRIGFAFDRFLVYGTGGIAAGRNTFQIIQGASATESAIHTGWVAGAGVEYGIGEHWSAKLEYLRLDLEEKTYFKGAPNGTTYHPSMNVDVVRAGVNYRFGVPD